MKRGLAFTIVFLILAGLGGGLAWFQFVKKPEMIKGFIAAAPKPVESVAAEAAREEKWAPTLPAIGTLRATQGIDLSSQVGGVIRELHIESGQDVKKGALLVQLDDKVEQADLKSSRATLVNADLALERQKQLLATNAGTQANFDAARATRDSAAATVERIRALIAQKAIVAPFSGRLGLRNVDLGQYVSPGTSFVTLQELVTIFVDFPMPEQDFEKLRVGTRIVARVDAYPATEFDGEVVSIDARINADTRNVMVRASFPNKELKLRPGMFANLEVVAGAPAPVVTVPRTAINYSLYGDTIFVVKEQQADAQAPKAATQSQSGPQLIAERRAVRTGDTRGERVSVIEGLKAGERVVTEGQIKLTPGAPVRVAQGGGIEPFSPLPKE